MLFMQFIYNMRYLSFLHYTLFSLILIHLVRERKLIINGTFFTIFSPSPHWIINFFFLPSICSSLLFYIYWKQNKKRFLTTLPISHQFILDWRHRQHYFFFIIWFFLSLHFFNLYNIWKWLIGEKCLICVCMCMCVCLRLFPWKRTTRKCFFHHFYFNLAIFFFACLAFNDTARWIYFSLQNSSNNKKK